MLSPEPMFSGIIEATSLIIKMDTQLMSSVRIFVARPEFFLDLKLGDSISVNGICLTVESFDSNMISFALGSETLQILNWSTNPWKIGDDVNLERSLAFGDRNHGHWVSGHVDVQSQVLNTKVDRDCLILFIQLPRRFKKWIWNKGSIAVNGVSLTVNSIISNSKSVNDFSEEQFTVCLIPETLKRTQLQYLKSGSFVNLEFDWMAKAFSHLFEDFLRRRNENMPP